jgi:hypothetical protein
MKLKDYMLLQPKNMKRIYIKLTKIDENNPNENGIKTGHIVDGFTFHEPIVEQCFVVFHDKSKMFKTSLVTEILSDNTFKTENSTYKLENVTLNPTQYN